MAIFKNEFVHKNLGKLHHKTKFRTTMTHFSRACVRVCVCLCEYMRVGVFACVLEYISMLDAPQMIDDKCTKIRIQI